MGFPILVRRYLFTETRPRPGTKMNTSIILISETMDIFRSMKSSCCTNRYLRSHSPLVWINTQTNAYVLIGSIGTNFSGILMKVGICSFTNMHFKTSFTKCPPLCPWLNFNVLTNANVVKLSMNPNNDPPPPPPWRLCGANNTHHSLRCLQIFKDIFDSVFSGRQENGKQICKIHSHILWRYPY